MRIILSGGEAAGVRAFRVLNDHGCPPVVVAADAESPLARAATGDGIEVVGGARLADPAAAAWVADQELDVLVNVHSLHLVAGDVLDALAGGGFNLHPGPLPAYAGLNTASWAIVNGEPRHAVTLHRMDPGIDTGAVVSEAWFDLDDRATGLSVSATCARLGVDLLADLLAHLRAGRPVPSVAVEGRRRLYRRAERPFGGLVPWSEPAAVVDRVVRACAYHPMPSPIGTPATRSAGAGELGLLAGTVVADPTGGGLGGDRAEPGTVVAVDEGRPVVATGAGCYRIERVHHNGGVGDATGLIAIGDRLR